jgi:hypothetical protein
MLKILFILPAILLSCLKSYGQCFADAGPDTTACIAWYHINDVSIGGTPAVAGGVPPYTYSWEADVEITVVNLTFHFSASDYLSDTTASNPDLIVYNANKPEIEFVLTVSDAVGNVCKDTVVIKFTSFSTNLAEYNYTVLEGDSMLYGGGINVIGGTPPLSYLWNPTNGLSDSTLPNFFYVKPNQQQNSYSVTVTDADGCIVQGGTYFNVYTGYLDIEAYSDNESKIVIFPNPSEQFINYNISQNQLVKKVEIYDRKGSIIQSGLILSNKINISHIPKGKYLLVFTLEDSSRISKFFVKN